MCTRHLPPFPQILNHMHLTKRLFQCLSPRYCSLTSLSLQNIVPLHLISHKHHFSHSLVSQIMYHSYACLPNTHHFSCLSHKYCTTTLAASQIPLRQGQGQRRRWGWQGFPWPYHFWQNYMMNKQTSAVKLSAVKFFALKLVTIWQYSLILFRIRKIKLITMIFITYNRLVGF